MNLEDIDELRKPVTISYEDKVKLIRSFEKDCTNNSYDDMKKDICEMVDKRLCFRKDIVDHYCTLALYKCFKIAEHDDNPYLILGFLFTFWLHVATRHITYQRSFKRIQEITEMKIRDFFKAKDKIEPSDFILYYAIAQLDASLPVYNPKKAHRLVLHVYRYDRGRDNINTAEACYLLAYTYYYGLGIRRNNKKAYATLSDIPSRFIYGGMADGEVNEDVGFDIYALKTRIEHERKNMNFLSKK